MTTSATASSSISALVALTDNLVAQINDVPPLDKEVQDEWGHIGYYETLKRINNFTRPLLIVIPGWAGIDHMEAWPKGRCECFVFATVVNEKITHVILTRNKEHGFLQHGAGEAGLFENSSILKAHRVAIEEFGLYAPYRQVQYLTSESENGFPVSHFVKGVSVILVTPEQSVNLKLTNTETNELVTIPVQEFFDTTDRDIHPTDYGFDRKHIARYIRNYNAFNVDCDYQVRETTDEDCRIAQKAKKWIEGIQVPRMELMRISDIFDELCQKQLVSYAVERNKVLKSVDEYDTVVGALQKVVDTVVSRLLPPWTYQGQNGIETARQVKVQKAAGIFINGNPLPSFLTIPQIFALENNLTEGNHRLKIVEYDQYAHDSIQKTESISTVISRLLSNINEMSEAKRNPEKAKSSSITKFKLYEDTRNITVVPA